MKLKQSNTKNLDLSKCPSILMRINSMEGWRLCTLASFSLFAFLSVCAHLSHESKKPERNSLSLSLPYSVGGRPQIDRFFVEYPSVSVFPLPSFRYVCLSVCIPLSPGAPFRIFSISGFVLFDSFFLFFFSVPPTKTEVAPRVVDSPFKPIVALPTPDFISSSPQPCALTELVTRYYFEFRSLLLTAMQSHANTLLRVFVFSPFLCRASLI